MFEFYSSFSSTVVFLMYSVNILCVGMFRVNHVIDSLSWENINADIGLSLRSGDNTMVVDGYIVDSDSEVFYCL